MRRYIPLMATFAVLFVLFGTASVMYEKFFTARVVANLFSDNAFLGITAIGMTFVILSGGIDLSVGAVLAFTMTFVASMVTEHAWHPLSAIVLALALGTTLGAGMGFLIQRYDLPPFLVTLGGMFFARGMAFLVSAESIAIDHEFYTALQDFKIVVGPKARLKAGAVVFLGLLALAVFVAHWTPFGRNLHAVGGNESSARLMGLPVARTKIQVYALNGLCSALAGVVATVYMGSGNPAMGVGLELDAIACVVIGGTLLTGGVGYVAGTLGGVLIFGTIQSALIFDGRLNSWWLRIAIGILLLIFILLQRQLSRLSTATKN
jgi:ribose/xylose/arabinose/galactoside ABC-type transport system permease subunit